MALFLQLVKFTQAGAAKLLSDGLKGRKEMVSEVVKSTGHGKLVGFWYVADGDWHVASIIDTTDDAATRVQAQLHQVASGAIEKLHIMRLTEANVADASVDISFKSLKEHLI